MMKKKRKKTLKKRATSRKTPQNLHMSHANRWPGVPAKHDYQHHPAPVAQYGTEKKHVAIFTDATLLKSLSSR